MTPRKEQPMTERTFEYIGREAAAKANEKRRKQQEAWEKHWKTPTEERAP